MHHVIRAADMMDAVLWGLQIGHWLDTADLGSPWLN